MTQPNGTVIPTGSHVQTLLDARGERLVARSDAAILPETFRPGCSLTFTLVSRGTARFQNAFGWYNATDRAPTPSDLHVLIPCDAPPGFVATLDVSHEPGYRGGDVGFFLRTPGGTGCSTVACCAALNVQGYSYFSQRGFNPDNTGGDSAYIHLLMYESTATPHAYYFAWEDLFNGGDNEFTDLVTLVSNIVCSGGGSACNTGRQGICALGTQQCHAGMLACQQLDSPQPEVCDDLDNDCNGAVDDAPGICPNGQVCDRGACRGRCLKDACLEGFSCSANGTCVQTACMGVRCAPGERCEDGRCVEPCDVVACPAGLVCRIGRCVDPCTGVRCDADAVCDRGVCQTRCECRGCPSGQSCRADGRCIETACAAVTCRAGEYCLSGRCRSACLGAVCPRGEVCRAGACELSPVILDAGSDSGANVDARAPDAGPDGGLDGGLGTPWHPEGVDGCQCAAACAPVRSGEACALEMVFVAVAVGRRTRRRRTGDSCATGR